MQVLQNRLLVEVEFEKPQTTGGIYKTQVKPTGYGTVISAGEDVKNLVPGDVVLMQAGAERKNPFSYMGKPHVIITYSDCVAVFPDEKVSYNFEVEEELPNRNAVTVKLETGDQQLFMEWLKEEGSGHFAIYKDRRVV